MQGWANDTALMTQRGQSMIQCVCVCVPLPSTSLQLLPNLLHRAGLMTQCGQRLPRRSIGTAVYVCVCLDKPQLMKCGTKTPSQIPQYNGWSNEIFQVFPPHSSTQWVSQEPTHCTRCRLIWTSSAILGWPGEREGLLYICPYSCTGGSWARPCIVYLQYSTVYHSISITHCITVFYSISQYFTVYHSIVQYITVFYSISQYSTVYHSIP